MINTLVVNVTLAELEECYNVCMEESNSALDVAVNVTGSWVSIDIANAFSSGVNYKRG